MIYELASFDIGTDRVADLVDEFPAAKAVLDQAPGLISSQLLQDLDDPGRVVLLVEWNTLEDHTEGFAKSDLFEQFRELVGPFVSAPPTVRHFCLPLES